MKRWKPKMNEVYFIINSEANIKEFEWWDDEIDSARWKFGNCFRTRKETDEARRRVKKALKGVK